MTAPSPTDMALYWNEALSDDLLSFFTGRIKCQEAAADLTQETFLRFQQFIQTTPPNNARALAFCIAVNLATDYQRKMKVRQKVMVDGEAGASRRPSDAQTLPDTGPERIVMARQQLQLVYTALEELPVDCRNAFIMHSIEGLTQTQIAARLEVSQVKVYRLLIKAMSHCQLRLNAQNEPRT
ncbi:MAG: sigma-70 family RNA polymerase sigma factor [Methylovulum sp.]|nr:sigma-70 family RNA polymerase sigma factor [Methylovulum sp.]